MTNVVTNFPEMDLPALGAHATAMANAADKNKERSENQYVSAGLLLIEAKSRVRALPGVTWGSWVHEHFTKGLSRSNELIAIAEGRTTVEEVRDRAARSMAETRAARQSPQRCGENSSANSTPQDALREAQQEAWGALRSLRDRVFAIYQRRVMEMDLAQLQQEHERLTR